MLYLKTKCLKNNGLKKYLQMQDGTQAVVQQPAQLAQGGQVIYLADLG